MTIEWRIFPRLEGARRDNEMKIVEIAKLIYRYCYEEKDLENKYR